MLVIAERIRDYLRSHGECGDSFKGILAWWLVRQRYEESAARVREALNYLCRQGEVEEDVGDDGSVTYFASPHAGTPR